MTDDSTIERWLPVPRFEGLYEVSSLGRVRSVDRTVASRNRWGPIDKHLRSKILAQTTDSYGYPTVTLFRGGKSRPFKVHRLVGEAFFGPLPPGQETLHGPDRRANAVTDLRYGTRAENETDKIRDGTFNHGGGEKTTGELNGNSRLTPYLVSEIRRLHAEGRKQKDLAKDFGVTQATISLIVRRKTWRHVL